MTESRGPSRHKAWGLLLWLYPTAVLLAFLAVVLVPNLRSAIEWSTERVVVGTMLCGIQYIGLLVCFRVASRRR